MPKTAKDAIRCVGLVRGINVGRAKRVAMTDLKAIVEREGYRDVRTVLNSGNVVFTASRATLRDAAERIEAGLRTTCDVAARAMVFASGDFEEIAAGNALGTAGKDPARLLVSFLRTPGDRRLLEPLRDRDWSPEALHVGSRAAYLWCPDGMLAGRVATAVDKVLGDAATVRNWATVMKLHALVSSTTS